MDSEDLKKESRDIFEELGVGKIPDEDKVRMMTRILELVETRTLNRVFDELNDEKAEELRNLGDEPEALEQFIEKNVPNYADLYLDEAKKVKQELLIEFSN